MLIGFNAEHDCGTINRVSGLELQLNRREPQTQERNLDMKWKAPPRRRSAPQRPRWRKPTATKPSKGSIQKRSGARKAPAPSYFSLLQDVVNFLKLDHVEGASMQKLKRAMEMRYGGRAFDEAECKMLKSAVKRLQNKGRIEKDARSTMLRFKPPEVPAYNVFGEGRSKGVRLLPIKPRERERAHLQVARRPVPVRRHVVGRTQAMRRHMQAGSAKRTYKTPSYKAPLRK